MITLAFASGIMTILRNRILCKRTQMVFAMKLFAMRRRPSKDLFQEKLESLG